MIGCRRIHGLSSLQGTHANLWRKRSICGRTSGGVCDAWLCQDRRGCHGASRGPCRSPATGRIRGRTGTIRPRRIDRRPVAATPWAKLVAPRCLWHRAAWFAPAKSWVHQKTVPILHSILHFKGFGRRKLGFYQAHSRNKNPLHPSGFYALI